MFFLNCWWLLSCSLRNLPLLLVVVSCGRKFLKKPQDTYLFSYGYPFYSPSEKEKALMSRPHTSKNWGRSHFTKDIADVMCSRYSWERAERLTALSIIFSSLKIMWETQIMLQIDCNNNYLCSNVKFVLSSIEPRIKIGTEILTQFVTMLVIISSICYIICGFPRNRNLIF